MASNRKFMSALNALCEEKGIEKDVFLEMLKESIAKAYKKNYMVPEANVRVEINEKTGKDPMEVFNQALENAGVHTETGIFGAMMKVSLINDGPTTIILDSKEII